MTHPHPLISEGAERFFAPTDLIVSKTDTKGLITYVNRTFQTISGFRDTEVAGQTAQHHPP